MQYKSKLENCKSAEERKQRRHHPVSDPVSTSDYIQRVLSKITLVGAFFLGIIAIFPIILGMFDNNLRSLSMGGTTVLIVVSVALETVRTLESQMMMRHHKGFLE